MRIEAGNGAGRTRRARCVDSTTCAREGAIAGGGIADCRAGGGRIRSARLATPRRRTLPTLPPLVPTIPTRASSTRSPLLLAGIAGILALSTAGAAAAQSTVDAPAARGTSFGVLAGVNLASFGGEDGDDLDDGRTGFLVGGFAVVRLSPVLAFQPEVLYAQKGAGGSISDGGGVESLEFQLSYLEAPLLLRVDVPGGGAVRPFLLAGPSIAINVGCEVEATFEGMTASVDCDEADAAEPETFDVGGLIGGGLEFPLGTRSLGLGVRYTFGFTDVLDGADAQNRTLGIVASLRF